ncbi:MAG: hypothetical protein JW881_03155 [Spirochaetales bacterium]|nr:hypothetical protein [Spirochaetales bacterium]
MDIHSSLRCSIRIGEIIIHLQCPTEDYAKDLRRYFNAKDESGQGIEIELEITAGEENIGIPESLFTEKSVSGNHFTITGHSASGFFDAATGKGKINVHYALTSSLRTRLFEQLMYQAFYSAVKRTAGHNLLIHSCGVIRDDRGYLFVGKSESGKTTIAGLSKTYSVLNDEITMIDLDGKIPVLHSTPFNGYFTSKVEGKAPLSSLFILRQSHKHAVTEIRKSTAVKTIFHEIVPITGLEDEITGETHERMLDDASEIAEKTPVYILEFRKDAGFWAEIDTMTKKNGVI